LVITAFVVLWSTDSYDPMHVESCAIRCIR